MSSALFLLTLGLVVFAAVYFPLAGWRSAKIAFIIIAWMPLALLLFMYFCQEYFERTLGYGLILLGFLLVGASLMLGAIGIILLIRATGRGESRMAVAVFTVAAFVPAAVYLRLLLA